jgi:hypothetical protein
MNATSVPAVLRLLLYLLVLGACSIGLRATYAVAARPSAASSPRGCLPTRDGYLRARMRGARDVEINWDDADMQCEGGLRPDDVGGLRVTFLGRLSQDGQPVRMIFGIATAIDAAHVRNVPANVTVIFEGETRIYSSAGQDKCTIDELSLQPVAEATGAWRRVVARGFCTVPVTAPLGGSGALEVDRFDFAGGLRNED